ncbi:MAG: hypothetical protein WA941_16480 [Nitrososphaeraceae archaeon]
MLDIQIGKTILNFGFVIVDMQNGFVSKGGSYDRRGMGIRNYRQVIPEGSETITL